uniref:Uncharacterized protein n=1 Tax=viral metagenome TaxID=1070528 RepID=A0A6C0BZC3_9ZZZZ
MTLSPQEISAWQDLFDADENEIWTAYHSLQHLAHRTCYTTLYSSSFIFVPCLFVVSLIIIWITKLSIEAC